jgi:hypothetical protein
MSSSRKKDSRKYEDMGGFERIIREGWEGQKRAKKIEEEDRKKRLARKRELIKIAKKKRAEARVVNGGVPGQIAIIVLFLSLSAIGSLIMLIPFVELLSNPYSQPISWISFGGYIRINFPFYDISLYYILGDPLSTYLAMSLILPMQFLIVQSLSLILKMQLVFYPLLSLLLIVLSRGLIKLENWARKGTIVFYMVSLGYACLTIFPFLAGGLNLAFFNVNILVALASITTGLFTTMGYSYYTILANMLHIILAVIILVYLFGELKHFFDTNIHSTTR